MASIVLFFLDGATGLSVFKNTGAAYFQQHGVYPTVDKQLPMWLTKNGWPCVSEKSFFTDPNGTKRECKGLKFDNAESLTAFILRWG